MFSAPIVVVSTAAESASAAEPPLHASAEMRAADTSVSAKILFILSLRVIELESGRYLLIRERSLLRLLLLRRLRLLRRCRSRLLLSLGLIAAALR